MGGERREQHLEGTWCAPKGLPEEGKEAEGGGLFECQSRTPREAIRHSFFTYMSTTAGRIVGLPTDYLW